ncbi:CUN035 putative p91 capsid virion protein, similar to AcMNPV ORF83 [Culex nigripalpus nucleopolyhedrovirus]|uniref:CUN035 putative p91 capsid virion protein, similar to AcMNPV ORF83 n=1 Tax=Culex nigripalpus nucleopolyhedrovirus (isolate Florida/1997) TaxID=645993 RepID=Q919N4_NPVCO|nr:CUN035 putative p91 capsid virion protein, similar to AcMNPV ORF83 [Culex nigripalpus nucleopolyhedrovirus]AAK94113.1 CUN035 putative p91 capsid virion protein, similar to AcMNPV ORF83 [Culex nigripalpus nucleopolyhedrovirus]
MKALHFISVPLGKLNKHDRSVSWCEMDPFILLLVVVFVVILVVILNTAIPPNIRQRRRAVWDSFLAGKSPGTDPSTFPVLSYIWKVDLDADSFEIETFNVANLSLVSRYWFQASRYKFDFFTQTLSELEVPELEVHRIRPHPTEDWAFELRVDDGWAKVSCGPPELAHFNPTELQCESRPPCDGVQPGRQLPLTRIALERLVYGRRVFISKRDDRFHPFWYVQCGPRGAAAIGHCPEGQEFNGVYCTEQNLCANRPDGFVLTLRIPGLRLNEFMECRNGEPTVTQCPNFDQIFETGTLRCVRGNPCQINGAGHTFVTETTAPNQFERCLNDSVWESVTCPVRVQLGGVWSCRGSEECTRFENGTGTDMFEVDSSAFKFLGGILHCQDYEIIERLECASEESSIAYPPFEIAGSFPSKVFDPTSGSCTEPIVGENLEIKVNTVGLTAAKHQFGFNFELHVRVNLSELTASGDQLLDALVYSRDGESLANDPLSEEPINCSPDPETVHFVDPLLADRINTCHWLGDERTFVQRQLDPSEYVVRDTIWSYNLDKISMCRDRMAQLDGDYLKNISFIETTEKMELQCSYGMPVNRTLESYFTTAQPEVYVDPECEGHELEHIFEIAVVLSPNLLCYTEYFPNENRVRINAAEPAVVPTESGNWEDFNFESQSSDGIKYLPLHLRTDGTWIACPTRRYNAADETCSRDTVDTVHYFTDFYWPLEELVPEFKRTSTTYNPQPTISNN